MSDFELQRKLHILYDVFLFDIFMYMFVYMLFYQAAMPPQGV